MHFLDEEFVTLVAEAEKKQDLLLITKANAMKRKFEETKSEIEQIAKALDILTKKKKDLK